MSNKLDVRLVALAFFAIAVGLRLIPHEYNMAALGGLGMFVGCYWSASIGFLMVVAAMAVSDVLGHFLGIPSMGFYAPWLMATVYVATGLSVLPGKLISKLRQYSRKHLLWGVPAGAVLSTAIFFLITNFASWLDPQMAYPQSLSGLVQCYIAAIPFAKSTLLGNVIYSGIFFAAYLALSELASHQGYVERPFRR